MLLVEVATPFATSVQVLTPELSVQVGRTAAVVPLRRTEMVAIIHVLAVGVTAAAAEVVPTALPR
jgi:hypothetical protein